MVGNSLVPILTSDNDQGFKVTYNSETIAPGNLAFDGNMETRWVSTGGGGWYGPVWIQIEFPKSIKLTGIVVNTDPYSAYAVSGSKDKITYSQFKGNQIIAKVVKITGGATPNDASLRYI